MYNLPGLNKKHLRLSGPVLAGIYDGQIKNWDDKRIQALNPGVKLPNLPVVPIHRADGSGDTFLFSQYLSFTTRSWSKGPNFGTSISWPSVPGSISATGNQGIVQQLTNYQGGVAYVGISWLTPALKDGLGEAAILNRAGQFLLPTNQTIGAAVAGMAKHTPKTERISLIFSSGKNSYPIINYEYAIVPKNQPNAQVAAAVKAFLLWAANPKEGNAPSFLGPVHFLPLPANVLPLSQHQISEIQ
jgi:phosphate transport system substrate-binding protein